MVTFSRWAACALVAAVFFLPAASAAPGDASVRASVPDASIPGRSFAGVRLAESGLSLSDGTALSALEVGPGSAQVRTAGRGKKNPMVALLLSCVLPGWGEIYAGDTTRGRWFMASEAAIWVGYGAFEIQAGMRTEDYEEFARVFAGAPDGASSDYLSDIGDYIRSEGDRSYNEAVRREARSLFPDDLDAQAQYLAEHGYYGDLAWDWGTRDRFYEYRELRRAASESERKAFYMTGLAVLNRALSAIDSAWMVRRHNAGGGGAPGARVSIAPEFSGGEVGARATLEVPF